MTSSLDERVPWIIAWMNQKGGQGKSTGAMELAVVISEDSGTTAVADADPQGTCRALAAASIVPLGFQVIRAVSPEELAIVAAMRGIDSIVVDTPGNIEDAPQISAVLRMAHYVIIPFIPKTVNIDPTLTTAQLVRDAGVRFRVLITQAYPDSRRVAEARELLDKREIPYFRTVVLPYVAHSDAQQDRVPITQYVPRGADARARAKVAADDLRRVQAEMLHDLGELGQ